AKVASSRLAVPKRSIAIPLVPSSPASSAITTSFPGKRPAVNSYRLSANRSSERAAAPQRSRSGPRACGSSRPTRRGLSPMSRACPFLVPQPKSWRAWQATGYASGCQPVIVTKTSSQTERSAWGGRTTTSWCCRDDQQTTVVRRRCAPCLRRAVLPFPTATRLVPPDKLRLGVGWRHYVRTHGAELFCHLQRADLSEITRYIDADGGQRGDHRRHARLHHGLSRLAPAR